MTWKLASVALICGMTFFAACSSDDAAANPGESDGGSSSGASSSSSSGGGASSSSSGGSSSSSSSSGDAGSDASACSQETQNTAVEMLDHAGSKAADLNANGCASDVTQGEIAELVQQAIDRCADVRATYTSSASATALRTALAGTLTDGLLRGKSLADAMIGATIYSVSQGVGPAPFALTFTAGGQVVSHECTFDDQVECNDRAGSYTLTDAAGVTTLALDFLNAPLTPGSFTVVAEDAIEAPVYRFEATGDDEGTTAYTFEDRCSA